MASMRWVAVVGVLLGLLAPTPMAAQQRVPDQSLQPSVNGDFLAHWQAEYTLGPPLPGHEAAIALLADGSDLWLATETEVSHFADSVWSPPAAPSTPGAIFALTAYRGRPWAFGFEGRIWQRAGDAWTAVASPTQGDLYAAGVNIEGLWAAGFDFVTDRGVIVHHDGSLLTATAPDWLVQQQLLALAVETDGTVWIGGCDFALNLFLARRPVGGEWETVPAPGINGCVYDLDFSVGGLGLAAAGEDVLVWNGSDWLESGLQPPDDKSWVRVAATYEGPSPRVDKLAGSAQVAEGTGWALAAIPRWPTFVESETPVYFDGVSWVEAEVDLMGLDALFEPSELNTTSKPHVALTSAGSRALSVSRIAGMDQLPGTEGLDGSAALLELSAGRITLMHPLIFRASDIVASDATNQWVAGIGAPGVMRHADGWRWTGTPTMRFVSDLDFASPNEGWSLGVWSDDLSDSVRIDAAWQWFNGDWNGHRQAAPNRVVGVRALPGGGAWGITRDGVLMQHDGNTNWTPVSGAPALRAATNPGAGLPFDVVSVGNGFVAWLSAEDGFYTFRNGMFTAVPHRGEYAVQDLQLVDQNTGWAIASEAQGPGVTRTLLGLLGRQWRPVPLPPSLRSVEWTRMSVARRGEVWFIAQVRPGDTGVPQQTLLRFDGLWRAFGSNGSGESDWPVCNATGLSAVPTGVGATDVWLIGTPDPCGEIVTTATHESGPVSRLRVRRVRFRSFLPAAGG